MTDGGLAPAGGLPAGFLAGMPARLRAAVLGGTPLPAEDAARAGRLDQEADEAALADMRARQAAFRQHAWDESLSRAMGYRDASLALLRPQQDRGGIVAAWLDGASRTLVLRGEARRGKTYAAYAVGNEAHRRGEWVTAWRVSDLLRHLRPSDLDPERAPRAYEAVTSAGLVILDDLGGESRTAWTVEQVMDVLDARVRNLRRTVVTTNLEPAGLRAAYGDPFVYRLIEQATMTKIEGAVIGPGDGT